MCDECMPAYVPTCSTCQTGPAPVVRRDGYTVYPFGALCPACVARVQAAGPWRERRGRALAVRVEALRARFPALAIESSTVHRVTLDGLIDGRGVNVTLRVAAREHTGARYVFRVTPKAPITIEAAAQALGHLTGHVSLVSEKRRYVRAAFLHLGKLDCLNVLTEMLAKI